VIEPAFPSPAERYGAFLFDLDGVLYRGDHALPGAAETVAALRGLGRGVVFLTNNSSRTPEQVAERLRGMDIPAEPRDVVTSAQATLGLLDGVGSAFVIGEAGVRLALEEAGVELPEAPERVDAVVVGWDREVTYEKLRRASVLVAQGARFVATNIDASYPAPGGELWPGAGALAAVIETTTGRRPEVVGKPARPMFDAALERAGTRDALMVGDRVETDAMGAVAAGIDAAVVFSGAASPATLLAHDAGVALAMEDVRGLLEPRPIVRIRRGRPEESEALADLLRGCGLHGEGDADEALVAEDRAVIGTASIAVRDGEAYLHSVAVRPEARGRHVGTLVAAGAVRRGAGEGARSCFLVTEDAAGFFARLGFEVVPRASLPGWMAQRSRACSESATAMRRELS
jgi:4-nitrophenyl phosphatase